MCVCVWEDFLKTPPKHHFWPTDRGNRKPVGKCALGQLAWIGQHARARCDERCTRAQSATVASANATYAKARARAASRLNKRKFRSTPKHYAGCFIEWMEAEVGVHVRWSLPASISRPCCVFCIEAVPLPSNKLNNTCKTRKLRLRKTNAKSERGKGGRSLDEEG